MHRPPSWLIAAAALLFAGCSSSSGDAPAEPSAGSSAPTSSAAAVAPELAGWASDFCAAVAPLGTLGSLPTPDTSTPESTTSTLTSFYAAGAAAFTASATALAPVGPPPVEGDEQLTEDAVQALTTSATQFQALADGAAAVDPADAAAVGSLVSGFGDAITALQASFVTLNQSQAPEVAAAIAAAPECGTLGG